MSPEQAAAAVTEGSRVRLRTMQGDAHAEGQIIGYSIVPTVHIVTDEGDHITWRHDLAEVVEATDKETRSDMRNLVQVLPKDGNWEVRASIEFDNKEDAEDAGRNLARSFEAEFQPHGEDGRIQDPDSFGNDPPEIKG